MALPQQSGFKRLSYNLLAFGRLGGSEEQWTLRFSVEAAADPEASVVQAALLARLTDDGAKLYGSAPLVRVPSSAFADLVGRSDLVRLWLSVPHPNGNTCAIAPFVDGVGLAAAGQRDDKTPQMPSVYHLFVDFRQADRSWLSWPKVPDIPWPVRGSGALDVDARDATGCWREAEIVAINGESATVLFSGAGGTGVITPGNFLQEVPLRLVKTPGDVGGWRSLVCWGGIIDLLGEGDVWQTAVVKEINWSTLEITAVKSVGGVYSARLGDFHRLAQGGSRAPFDVVNRSRHDSAPPSPVVAAAPVDWRARIGSAVPAARRAPAAQPAAALAPAAPAPAPAQPAAVPAAAEAAAATAAAPAPAPAPAPAAAAAVAAFTAAAAAAPAAAPAVAAAAAAAATWPASLVPFAETQRPDDSAWTTAVDDDDA
jgi:hypothetical protein